MTKDKDKEKEQAIKDAQDAIDTYLKNGGKIQSVAYGTRTDPELIKNSWGHKPKAPFGKKKT